MKKKYYLVFLWAIICTITMIINGCDSKQEKSKIAIIKFTSHPALDEFETAFIERLEEKLKSNPELSNYEIDKYNANRNYSEAKQLAESVSKPNIKLLVAIATPAIQAINNTPSNIPTLYGAVADPKGAGVIPSNRITGISNVDPKIITLAVKFIKTAFPKTKKIGSIYNPSEQNSVYVQDILADECKSQGIELIQRTVSDASQVSSMTVEILKRVDVLYSANDNTVNSAIASVVSICDSKNFPFIIGDLSTLADGPLVAVGLSYSKMGKQLADIAIQILEGKTVKDFPPQSPPKADIWLNQKTKDLSSFKFVDSVATYSMIDSIISNE